MAKSYKVIGYKVLVSEPFYVEARNKDAAEAIAYALIDGNENKLEFEPSEDNALRIRVDTKLDSIRYNELGLVPVITRKDVTDKAYKKARKDLKEYNESFKEDYDWKCRDFLERLLYRRSGEYIDELRMKYLGTQNWEEKYQLLQNEVEMLGRDLTK